MQQAIMSLTEYVKSETLVDQLISKIEADHYPKEWDINEERIVIGISKC